MTLKPHHSIDSQEAGSSQPAPSNLKKTYKTPSLVAWGSVRDLTQGPKAGFEDMDFTGTQEL